jgi:hypothetical protein
MSVRESRRGRRLCWDEACARVRPPGAVNSSQLSPDEAGSGRLGHLMYSTDLLVTPALWSLSLAAAGGVALLTFRRL